MIEEKILDKAPYSQEWESHIEDINYEFTTISDMVSEVAYCISKYTEDGFDNYECLNEDYSWIPPKNRKQYESHQKQLKKELKELKNLYNYLKETV